MRGRSVLGSKNNVFGDGQTGFRFGEKRFCDRKKRFKDEGKKKERKKEKRKTVLGRRFGKLVWGQKKLVLEKLTDFVHLN